MSLLPKIPCRKLFCDSRFAEGTASEFAVEIPEGGLDLGDNTVAFVDQISVPSIQNVVDGRNTIYYEETLPVHARARDGKMRLSERLFRGASARRR